MKKVIALLTLAFLIISAILLYLIKSGISIRSAPIIRPSIITRGGLNIAQGVILRLAPEFQNSHYIIWGTLHDTPEYELLLKMMKEEFMRVQPKAITIISDAQNATVEEIKNCQQPCWLFVPQDQAHEIGSNEFLQQKIQPLGRSYSTITFISFSKIPEVSETCSQQKRLTFDCLKTLSIHEAKRKMKKDNERYFFMRKHLDRDFFLFIQEAPTS